MPTPALTCALDRGRSGRSVGTNRRERPVGRGSVRATDRRRVPSTALRLVGLLLPGDQLGCDALLEIALASGLHRDADLIYGDEVRISPGEPRARTVLQAGFLARPAAVDQLYRPALVRLDRAAWASRRHAGAALLANRRIRCVLRCTEQAEQIHHVPRLLCRGERSRSTTRTSKQRR